MFLKKWFRLLSIAALFAFSFLFLFFSPSRGQEQKELSEAIIRFHVIANSDSEQDQALKLMVRDAVLKEMDAWTSQSASISETRAILKSRLSDIQAIAEETLSSEGCSSLVTVSLENCYFPVKTYGDLTFPAGNYEALRIQIGEANGRNWWCVLYPPLCFLDASTAQVSNSSRTMLKEALSGHTYESLYGTEEKGLAYGKTLAEDLLGGKVPLKSRLAEWLSELFSSSSP